MKTKDWFDMLITLDKGVICKNENYSDLSLGRTEEYICEPRLKKNSLLIFYLTMMRHLSRNSGLTVYDFSKYVDKFNLE